MYDVYHMYGSNISKGSRRILVKCLVESWIYCCNTRTVYPLNNVLYFPDQKPCLTVMVDLSASKFEDKQQTHSHMLVFFNVFFIMLLVFC